MTITDIASRAGVSKSSASCALNGLPGVSDQTRERVLAVAAELGWIRHRAAHALSGAGAGAIGLVVARPPRTLAIEPFFMELISGVESVLVDRALGLMVQVVAGIEDELATYRRWWGERRVDGVIVVDARRDDPRVPLLEELGMPAVFLGGGGRQGTLPCVWSDDAAAVRMAVGYLAALGHRHLARVGGNPDFAHTTDRDEAFRSEAECVRGLRTTIVHADYSGEDGARATRLLLSDRPSPTAIMYDNDVMAVAGVGVVAEMGLDIPRDISIVAWGDSALCRLVRPPLTALSGDTLASGARAAELVVRLVDEGVADGVQEPTLVLSARQSTAPPAAR